MSVGRCLRLSLTGAALALAALAGGTARAQVIDPDKAAAAQAIFEQAVAEMDNKQYASACPRLEEVTRLVPSGLGAKLALGECYEALGKLASAWSQYALVQALAASAGQPERSQEAARKAAALKPRLASLTVRVADAARSIAGLSVVRDGVLLGEAQLGEPVPVDAGAHEVVVSAPDHKPWKKRVEVVADGVNVVVEAGAPTAIVKLPEQGAAAPAATWQKPLALGVIGLGAAAAGVGAALGALALDKNSQSNQGHCNAEGFCDAAGADLRNDARAFGNVSTAAIIAGGALLAGGAVLLVVAPGAKRAGSALEIEVRPGGLSLRRSF